jgi:SAM-dependent methyltransferase
LIPAQTLAANAGTMSLSHIDASFVLEPQADGRRRLTVVPNKPGHYVRRSSVITSYPDDLLARILSNKGVAYLCDEIARDQDPAYVLAELDRDLLAYVSSEELKGRRILDFGCGAGASTMILQRLFPEAQVYGVELDPDLLSIAHARARFYGFPETRLMLSPGPTELPSELGQFDFVVLSAVYEHLLPRERAVLLPKLWSLLAPRGILFMNQTPWRFGLVESHTTKLPLLNYLPDWLTCLAARKLSKRVDPGDSWETLLRRGIRGGSPREILRNIRASRDGRPKLLEPSRGEIQDRIDLWFATSSTIRWRASKHVLRLILKATKLVTGMVLVPALSLAICKVPDGDGLDMENSCPKHTTA